VMNFLLSVVTFLALLAGVLGSLFKREATKRGKAEQRAATAEATTEKVLEHAKNTGELRTDSDVVGSLRRKAASKRADPENEGKR
jgi:hypothetical protein